MKKKMTRLAVLREARAVLKAYGDRPGHPFRGNQWTGGTGGAYEGMKTARLHSKLAALYASVAAMPNTIAGRRTRQEMQEEIRALRSEIWARTKPRRIGPSSPRIPYEAKYG